MKCKLCQEFYKKHPLNKEGLHRIEGGSYMEPIKCAFETKRFKADNWNCQTINELREISEKENLYVWNNDNSLWITTISNGNFIFLLGYKQRGNVEKAFIIEKGMIKPLTLKVAEKAIKEGREK